MIYLEMNLNTTLLLTEIRLKQIRNIMAKKHITVEMTINSLRISFSNLKLNVHRNVSFPNSSAIESSCVSRAKRSTC